MNATWQQWDNPIPMPCSEWVNTRNWAYAQGCNRDAFYVQVNDGEAIRFRCHSHAVELGGTPDNRPEYTVNTSV
jgi:hypothetical protein